MVQLLNSLVSDNLGMAQSVIMQLPSQALRQSLTISTTTIALRQEWWSSVSTCPHWPRSKTVYEPRSMRSSICTGVRPGTLDSHSCRHTSRTCHGPGQDKQLCIKVATRAGPALLVLATEHCRLQYCIM